MSDISQSPFHVALMVPNKSLIQSARPEKVELFAHHDEILIAQVIKFTQWEHKKRKMNLPVKR